MQMQVGLIPGPGTMLLLQPKDREGGRKEGKKKKKKGYLL